jgi:F-type H+-transporting ATPase subunit a
MDLLSQFAVKTYLPIHFLGYDFSMTNASFFMILSVMCFCVVSNLALKSQNVIPTPLQSFLEIVYQFLIQTVKTFSGKEGAIYFPYFFALFSFIFVSNLLGIIPSFFTTTSQIILTLSMAFMVFISVIFIGIKKHKMHFFSLFIPKNVPWYIAVILVPIEVISYIAKPFSLAIRLFANMLAGHILLKIFASFAAMSVGKLFIPISSLSFFINLAFTFFEIGVAFLQAYIFTILSCIYLKDALYLH